MCGWFFYGISIEFWDITGKIHGSNWPPRRMSNGTIGEFD